MSAGRPGFLRRLYRGEANVNFIGPRRKWYLASAVLLLICVLSLSVRWFNFGIEFAGGSQYTVPATAGVTLADVRDAAARVVPDVIGQEVGKIGDQHKFVLKTPKLETGQQEKLIDTVAAAAHVDAGKVSTFGVSSSWGKDVTRQALIGLIVFLIAVGVYIWIRYEQKMAAAALFALLHDLLLTAGVYSLVGFEVTPGTVVGLLTILGFSLYDTVVVFDKVDENTRGLLGSTRMTYPEAANLAVNQTLMRSINTSLIALLPVGGLLFIGAGILGVGTLKDLALVLFVGMLTGAYSSLFLATPWLVDLKMLEPRFKMQAQRVLAKRSGASVEPKVGRTRAKAETASGTAAPATEELAGAGTAPAPGAKPAARPRPGGRPGRPHGARKKR